MSIVRMLFDAGRVSVADTLRRAPTQGRSAREVPLRTRTAPPPTGSAEQCELRDELAPARRWPTGVALLQAQQDSADACHVKVFDGAASDSCLGAARCYRPPRMNVDLLEARGDAANKMRQAFASWSRKRLEIRKMIDTLRRRHRDELNLVVRDDTPFDIPWEAFRLVYPPEGLDGGWLGALVRITRWATLANGVQELDVAERSCSGALLGYLDEDVGGGDVAALAPYANGGVFNSARKMEFLAALRAEAACFALVYVGDHGSVQGTVLGHTAGPFSLSEEEERSAMLPEKSSTIFFLNACGSAKMIDSGGVLHGFPEVFLSNGAVGMIGATAAVGAEFAGQLAARLLDLAEQEPGVPVPELLRRVREAEAAALPDEPDDEAAWRWIDAFSYVYYGNPLATLALERSAG